LVETERQRRERFGEPALFADVVTEDGYERHYQDGHTPLMECHSEPEAFDPPFGSGQVVATSKAYVAWARRRFLALRLEMEAQGDGA
jgi:hypothetical protein